MKKAGKKAMEQLKKITEKVRTVNKDVDYISISYCKSENYNSYFVKISAGDETLYDKLDMIPR